MEKKERRRLKRPEIPVRMNIGIFIFFIILVYVLFSVISFVTSDKTELYEVRMGTLSQNEIYRGIALRSETLVKSRYTGTINYYNKEGDRVRVGGLAYSVDENGEIADYADPDIKAMDYYTDRDFTQFRNQVINFVSDFSPSKFYTVYDFNSASASQAQKISNRAILKGYQGSQVHDPACRESRRNRIDRLFL